MIVKENIEIDGIKFVRTYSDAGRYVLRDGIAYEEAIDPIELEREYSEGEAIQKIEPPQPIGIYQNKRKGEK